MSNIEIPEPFSIPVNAEIIGEGATLSALIANADAFRAFGGSPLMLTEHVENGIDAIKVRADWNDKDNRKHIGKIEIIIDDKNSRVIVIDDGSGIEDPLWILGHPLHSRKSGLKYQVGKYGRGLQGFRGFCKNLEYITIREKPHPTEEQEYQKAISEGKLPQNFDPKCIKLKLIDTSTKGKCIPVSVSEIKKYTNSKTGTVVIFSNWHDGDFEELKRRKDELFNRLQHHFRDVLENELMDITITYDDETTKILARDFSDKDRFPINDFIVINPHRNESVGTIKFFLYKSSGADKHEFKKPFLLAKDHRPLQNSFLSEMPHFKDDPIWRSPYVTGYITCDFVEPNQLRIALSIDGDLNEKNRLFYSAVRAVSIELKKLVSEYQAGFLQLERRAQNQNIIMEIQSFLKKQKIKLDLPSLAKSGVLQNGNTGSKTIGNRVSSKIGTKNQGRIISEGTDEVVILYDPEERRPPGQQQIRKLRNEYLSKLKIQKKMEEQRKLYKFDPNLLSKDGRRTKRSQAGINLDTIQEELNPDMSYYDPNTMTVYVNELHHIFQKMNKLKNAISENSVYSKKQKNFIRRCYMWELIKNFHKTGDGEEKYEKFWELYHTFFLYKDDT